MNEPPAVARNGTFRRFGTRLDRHGRGLLLAPPFLLVLVVVGYPIAYSLWVSIVEFNGRSANSPFVGLRNYRIFVEDGIAQKSVVTTAALALVACALELVLGYALAFVVSRPFRGRGLLTVVCVLPLFVSPVVAAQLWILLLRAGTGPVDIVYSHVLGHPLGIDWAVAPWGYVTILLVDVWQWTSFMFLILLVGLSSVPSELHEAADIDGARPIRTMRSITLPLIVPYIVTAVVVRIIDAAKLFEVPYTLTGGHPGLDMYTISFYLFESGFVSFFQSFAAAGSWLLLGVLFFVSFPLLYLLRTGETS
jgi:multiple sugar transport system permease protein